MASHLNLSAIFNEVQQKLETNINVMLEDVLSKNSEYKEFHDNIMSLPFVVKLVEENKLLKKKLENYETKRISLEVEEKSLVASACDTHRFIYTDDGETMLLAKNQVVPSSKTSSQVHSEEASAEEEEDEASAEEEEASAEEEEEEASAEEEEASAAEEEEASAAEEEEASVAEEEEASAAEEEESSVAEEEEEEASVAKEEEEEDEEVEEIMINKKMYYTTNAQNGYIYADDDGDVGDVVGKFVNGEAQFD
jgi:glucan-binding YG repeat protein